MLFTEHSKCVFCRTGPYKKMKNDSWAQMVLVNILLIVMVGLTFPWINTIFYRSPCGLAVLLIPAWTFLWTHTATFCCLPLCLDPSLFLFICICPSLFFQSSFSTSPRISQALWLLTALSLSLSVALSPISHLLSGVSVSQAGRPWSDLGGNELLITSQETRYSTPTLPPSLHPMQHTKKEKKKTTQLSYAQPTKRNSIAEAGQQGRSADEKSLETQLLQALIHNYQTSKIK